MNRLRHSLVACVLCALCSHASFALTLPDQVSLNDCQNTVKAEGMKFVRSVTNAIAMCLQKLSTSTIRNNAPIDQAAAATCITQFRKLNDTRGVGKSFKEKLSMKIMAKCEPLTGRAHSIGDVTGIGATVPQPINTKLLNQYCQNFGLDGSVDSIQQWIDCLVVASECEAEQAIAKQYPRASEWLSAVQEIIARVPMPAADPTRNSDAQTALANVRRAIDSNDDLIPDITCPLVRMLGCSTACCYIEQSLGTLKPTACFEYTGSSREVTAFKNNCAGKQDSTGTQWVVTPTNAACSAGPNFGVTCRVGVGNNAVAVANDTPCP